MNLKKQLVASIISTLKIDSNPFNVGLLEDLLKNVKENEYREFYNMLFGEDKNYMNGLDRAKTVSEFFNKRRDKEQLAIENRVDILYSVAESISDNNIPLDKIKWKDRWSDTNSLTEKEIEIFKRTNIKELTKNRDNFIAFFKQELGFRKDLLLPTTEWS